MLSNFSSGMIASLQRILSTSVIGKKRPSEATIFAIDGVRIDIRLKGSNVVVRNIPVIGDVTQLQIGQIIQLRWEAERPVALATTQAGILPVSVSIQADNDTLENSPIGLRVKRGGVRAWHLAFVPSMEGHTHQDIFQRHGWSVTDDGTIYKGDTHIHPDGQISLGSGSDTIKLDSKHGTYRIWAGANMPEDATFKVTKLGELFATAGEIAGWDITDDMLSKNNVELDPLGQILAGSGDDVAVMGTTQGDWRFWAGNADPSLAPFRVDKYGNAWLDSATIALTLESANFQTGVRGWKLYSDGTAELEDVIIRGRISTAIFTEVAISTISGQMLLSLGATLIADVADDDTSIDVDTAVLSADDIVHLKPDANRSEYMRITTTAQVIDGGYRYGVTRGINDLTPPYFEFYSGEILVRKGSGVVSVPVEPLASGTEAGAFGEIEPTGSGGTSGGGWLELDGATPYFGVMRRTGPVWDQFARVVQIGNLVGSPLTEYITETYGVFIGDVLQYLVYDPDNGLRMYGAGITTPTFSLTRVDDAPAYVDQEARFFFIEDYPDLKVKIRMKDGASEQEIVLATDTGIVDANRLQGRDIASTAPEDGQALVWDEGAGEWTPSFIVWLDTTQISLSDGNYVILSDGNDAMLNTR